MADLGRISKLDPRTVWKNEATNFTPWLAKNLEQLGELLGLDLELTQSEAAVGNFAVDLVARDLGRDRVVIIENQLEPTDHSHLGQIITYAAGLEAGIVIWISREFRDEHREALDWLNRVHVGQTEFFGIVVELLRVDESRPAVNFRLVASPNQWSRRATPDDRPLTPRREAYRQFFQGILDELREVHRFTNARAAQPQNWYSFTTGEAGYSYALVFALRSRVRVELYIDSGDAEQNECALEELMGARGAIEREFGEPLEWERLDDKRACRVACYRPGIIEAPKEELAAIHNWAVDRLLRLKKVLGPRLRPFHESE